MISLNILKKLKGIVSITNDIENLQLSFTTDSRKFSDENTFIAIKGEKFDGFDYVEGVLEKDCRVCVFEYCDKNKIHLNELKTLHPSCCFVAVENVVKFLQILGQAISEEFYNAGGKIICISGSNGKTTTKEMVAFLLSNIKHPTIKTLSNNNNHIGVPLTLLQIKEDTKYAIIELGSNHPGEIALLCNILNPHIGYTTNIGHTHLEFFENLENVYKEEAYLHAAITKSGKVPKLFLVNNYDEHLKQITGRECIYLQDENNQINADFDKCNLIFKGNEYEISNPNLTGKHNFFNIGAAIVLVHEVTGEDIKQFVEISKNFKPSNNRSEWIIVNQKTNVFLDAYNANPSSMKEAIDGFYGTTCNKGIDASEVLYILGDMNELGSGAEAFHQGLGEYLQDKKVQNVWFVGRYSKNYQQGLPNSKRFENTKDAKSFFISEKHKFKYVFIKGSRSLQLESIIDIT